MLIRLRKYKNAVDIVGWFKAVQAMACLGLIFMGISNGLMISVWCPKRPSLSRKLTSSLCIGLTGTGIINLTTGIPVMVPFLCAIIRLFYWMTIFLRQGGGETRVLVLVLYRGRDTWTGYSSVTHAGYSNQTTTWVYRNTARASSCMWCSRRNAGEPASCCVPTSWNYWNYSVPAIVGLPLYSVWTQSHKVNV